MRRRHLMPFGAELVGDGVRFVLWAPSAGTVTLVHGEKRVPMAATGQGWFKLTLADAKPGDLYGFAIDDASDLVPDPVARFQPDDADRRSAIVDPDRYEWTDHSWTGRPWTDAIICEIHVGTATPEGTFAALTERLEHYRDAGFTAIELMPVAQTPGQRTWGYDGVLLFAPNNAYGGPDDLKRLIDRAHRLGLMVLLDVVYNHFGPSGNFLGRYAAGFFTQRHQTPWGAGINFDGDTAGDAVREFFIQNALYWLKEYHFDGLRFDAVHMIFDHSGRHFLDEMAGRIRDLFSHRAVHLILENPDNEASRLQRDGNGEAETYDAQWNDDIHHCWHRLLTGETDGYYGDFGGDAIKRLGRCYAEGFAYQGEFSTYFEKKRGEETSGLPPEAFVACLQNHDQVGNREKGDRIGALCDPKRLSLARALTFLSPQIPMLFMGEEWGASTPFHFFVDCPGETDLEKAIRAGREREYADFSGRRPEEISMSDPAAVETFAASKLDWREPDHTPFAGILKETRDLLQLRRNRLVPLFESGFVSAKSEREGKGGLKVEWRFEEGTLRFAANFEPQPMSIKIKPDETVLWHSAGVNPGKTVVLQAWSGIILVELRESETE